MFESVFSDCFESLDIGENGDWKSLVSSPKFVDLQDHHCSAYEEMAPKTCLEEFSFVNFESVEGGLENAGPGKLIATKCGFRYSPYLPLASPIIPSNSEKLSSPTTGTYALSPYDHENLALNSEALAADGDKGSDFGTSRVEPHGSPTSLPQVSAYQIQPPSDFEFPQEFPKEAATENCATDSSSEENFSEDKIQNTNNGLAAHQSPTNLNNDQISPLRESFHGEDSNLLVGEQKEAYPPGGTVRNSDDGYNWRKYGQKQVKGSEFPRSYYKCTQANCAVKKKVERSHDGQITEIIYTSAHNHPKPHQNRRLVIGSPHSFGEMADEIKSSVKVEGGVVCRNSQLGCKDFKVGSDWRSDGLERPSSTTLGMEISDPLSTSQGKSICMLESVGTPELPSTLASHDDDDDGATQGSISPGDDADDEGPELKRNKKDSYSVETNLASRAVREPRVVVEIESVVDILEDGYRWRKYGQKVVKGNPNPRSYYKCTSPGCLVRKHVERASHNLKFIITTYEGKHNHEVPVSRNNSHANSGSGASPLAASNATEPPLTSLARNCNGQKPDSQVQDLALHFERKPEMDKDLMRSGLLGNYGNDMRFRAPSLYQMKFPPLQNTIPFGTFLLNNTTPQNLPDFPISSPSTIPQPPNMAMGRFDFNNNGKPAVVGPSQSFLGDQQLKEYDTTRLVKPKLEQKDDVVGGSGVYGPSSFLAQPDSLCGFFGFKS